MKGNQDLFRSNAAVAAIHVETRKCGHIKLVFKRVKSPFSLVKSALLSSGSPSDLSVTGRLMSSTPAGRPVICHPDISSGAHHHRHCTKHAEERQQRRKTKLQYSFYNKACDNCTRVNWWHTFV